MAIKKAIYFTLFFCYYCLAVFADGSRDFYYNGVRGNRGYLVSSNPAASVALHNFGTHFVYAKQGETLALASSAQNVAQGKIRVTSPSGYVFTTTNSDVGRIMGTNGRSTRQAELAGPRIGYTPYEVSVTEEGIWRVEFIAPVGEYFYQNNIQPPDVRANEDWIQLTEGNLIAAWDVSVRNAENSDWVKGRVYTNILNFHISLYTLQDANGALYGVNYVLTNDGYLYRVDANGSHGILFSYFVNNTGLLDLNNQPIYKSSNDGYGATIHNPNTADDVSNVTHKMFYTLPDTSMPMSSRGAVPGGNTWLYGTSTIPEVTGISLTGVEGNVNYISRKGSVIKFTSTADSRYRITIQPGTGADSFTPRHIIVQGKEGENQYIWDGLDGDGNLLPMGKDYPVDISIASVEGEIHFPYFDMEINPQGILVERVDHDGVVNSPAILYWDDSDITPGLPGESSNPLVNLEGIPSNINGHKWGTYDFTSGPLNTNAGTGAYSFGNDKAIDTWSYSIQANSTQAIPATVEVVDLELVRITADKDTIELEEEVTYEVVVRNNGPSDAIGGSFEFQLPKGFYIDQVYYSSTCGKAEDIRYVDNGVTTKLSLPNSCELTFTIRTKARNVPDATYGIVEAEGGVVRPADFTDPDATSPNSDVSKPGSAREECAGDCNNIIINKEVFLLEPFEERGQLALLKTVRHIDANGSAFQEIGEVLRYSFTIKNIGFVNVSDLLIRDPMLSSSDLLPVLRVLAPGEQVVFTYDYTISSEDVKRKYVENSAIVYGKNPRGFEVKDISGIAFDNNIPTYQSIDEPPLVYLKKTISNAGTGENAQFTLGDKIEYLFEVRHEGEIPYVISGIEDVLLSTDLLAVPRQVISNEEIQVSYSYRIEAEDIERGFVNNSAVLKGVDQKFGRAVHDISGTTYAGNDSTHVVLARPVWAHDDAVSTYQRNDVYIDVLANDVAGSSTFSAQGIQIVDFPVLGRVQLTNGGILYQPIGTNYGEDFFTYKITDGSRLESNKATVHITIDKTVPVAVPDIYTVGINYHINLNLAENDYVPFGELDYTSIEIAQSPSNGTVTKDTNGQLVYAPMFNYTGFDEFLYTIKDINGNISNEGLVRVEIKGFEIPNTITPNGDGYNDTFVILGMYVFDQVELQVVNRFGQQVYYSADYQNDWEVSPQIADGVYYYVFVGRKSGQKEVVRKGSLLIVRDIAQRYRSY